MAIAPIALDRPTASATRDTRARAVISVYPATPVTPIAARLRPATLRRHATATAPAILRAVAIAARASRARVATNARAATAAILIAP